MSYYIGSFNCLNFGRNSSKDINAFADIIINERFDIIALQEIKNPAALKMILNRLPTYWNGIADTECYDYAFVWNSHRFELANAFEAGKDRIYQPRIYKQYKIDRKAGQTDLVREPYFARFFPVGGAAPYIEIRLINTHIRFSKGIAEQQNLLSATLMRNNEFDILTKAIYAKESDKRYGNNRPAYTILLGDYNLNLNTPETKAPYLLESFEIIDGSSSKVITTFQKELSTLAKPDEQNSKSIFSSNYDHFTFDINRFSDTYVCCNRVNTVEKYFNGNSEKHIKDLSDHVPVKMNLSIGR